MDRDEREKHRERLNASPTQITETRRRKRGKVVTHSFQSGSLEQTAHRCREPELQETKKEEEDDETMRSPGLSQQGWTERLPADASQDNNLSLKTLGKKAKLL